MNSLATQIANLSGEKRALLLKLVKSINRVGAEIIPKQPSKNSLPLPGNACGSWRNWILKILITTWRERYAFQAG
jgi:hypothetical protein